MTEKHKSSYAKEWFALIRIRLLLILAGMIVVLTSDLIDQLALICALLVSAGGFFFAIFLISETPQLPPPGLLLDEKLFPPLLYGWVVGVLIKLFIH